MNPFLQSDQDEQDGVSGEAGAPTESQDSPKPIPAGRPPPSQVKPDRPPVPSLPVNKQQSQAETTEV